MRAKTFIAFFSLSAVLSITVSAHAQVLYGTLTGNVVDATGAAIPAAKVEAVNGGTGLTKQSSVDANGSYVFNNLQAAPHKVTISAASFGLVVEEGVLVDANSVRRVDVKLQPAEVSQYCRRCVGHGASGRQGRRQQRNSKHPDRPASRTVYAQLPKPVVSYRA